MIHPELLMSSSTYFVPIKDVCPKNRHHCLVLIGKQLSNLQSMTKKNINRKVV